MKQNRKGLPLWTVPSSASRDVYKRQQMLRDFRFQHAFIGCYGMSVAEGKCFDLDMASTNMKLIAMEHAAQRYLLVDDSKLEKKGFYTLADLSSFDKIYTTKPKTRMKLPKNLEIV